MNLLRIMQDLLRQNSAVLVETPHTPFDNLQTIFNLIYRYRFIKIAYSLGGFGSMRFFSIFASLFLMTGSYAQGAAVEAQALPKPAATPGTSLAVQVAAPAAAAAAAQKNSCAARALSINAEGTVITAPYQPGMAAYYPRVSNVAQSSLLGGIAYLLARGQKLVHPAYVGMATFLGSCAYTALKRPNLVDALLTNPNRVLRYAYMVNDQFTDAGKRQGLDKPEIVEKMSAQECLAAYHKLQEHYQKECAFFQASECVRESFGPCVLSRDYRPEYREAFEQKVVSSLLEKCDSVRGPVHYASFGCGGRFQDLVTITKTLARKPDAHLVIHLMDLKHSLYTDCRDLMNNTREVNEPTEQKSVMAVMKQLKEMARKEGGSDIEQMSDNALEQRLIVEVLGVEKPFIQFLAFLKRTFPRANIVLFLHNTTQDYIDYITKNRMPYPDVIAAADIEDEMSLMYGSMRDYSKLCVQTLQNKSVNTNILLGKKGGQAALYAFSLVKTASAEEGDITINDTKIKVYATETPIAPRSLFDRIKAEL
jgi:hypothetical protein